MNTLEHLPLSHLLILMACTATALAVWEWFNREPPTPPPAVAADPIVANAIEAVRRTEIAALSTPVEAEPSARERYDRAIAAYVQACDEWNAASINLRNTTHYTTPTEQGKTQQQA